jgi:hypothetical protein
MMLTEVFWVVTPCKLVDNDVSDDRIASILSKEESFSDSEDEGNTIRSYETLLFASRQDITSQKTEVSRQL